MVRPWCGASNTLRGRSFEARINACLGRYFEAVQLLVQLWVLFGHFLTSAAERISRKWLVFVAPRVGIEPTTNGLTVRCSTAELPGNWRDVRRARILRQGCPMSQGTRPTHGSRGNGCSRALPFGRMTP